MKNRIFSPALALLTGLSAFLATNSAQAVVLDPLPDAEYYNGATAVFTQRTALRSNGISSSSGTSSASTQNDYDIPYLSAAANAGVGANAESYLAYWMRITGPTSAVQVHIEAEGQTTGAGSSVLSQATLNIVGRVNGESGLSFKACSNCSGSSRFLVDQMYTFETNSAYQIKMDASVGVSFGSATAWVDPFFDVPDGYSIEFSRGIGNAPLVAAVPEPSTWAMMILGFAGLAFAANRRRSSPAAAAA